MPSYIFSGRPLGLSRSLFSLFRCSHNYDYERSCQADGKVLTFNVLLRCVANAFPLTIGSTASVICGSVPDGFVGLWQLIID